MTSLSAVEFMDWESASIAMDYLKIENPLNEKYKFYLLVEMSGNTMEELMQEQMLELLEKLEDHYEDGVMCDSESQKEQIWAIREGISMAASGYGLVSIIYYFNILYLGVQIRYFYTVKRFFRHY